MRIKRANQPDWYTALHKLSHGAMFLLMSLWYDDFEISDKSMMARTKVGVSTHRKHKRELTSGGYLVSKQVGKGVYRYHIGESVNG